MKKIVFIIAAMMLTSLCVTSCLEDAKSSFDGNYYGACTSINYTDSADTVWQKNIIEALNKQTIFSQYFKCDTTVSSSAISPIILCNSKAVSIYLAAMKKLNLKDIKTAIFNAHADSLIKIGYPVSDSITLKPFYIGAGLVSTYAGSIIFSDTTLIQ